MSSLKLSLLHLAIDHILMKTTCVSEQLLIGASMWAGASACVPGRLRNCSGDWLASSSGDVEKWQPVWRLERAGQ